MRALLIGLLALALAPAGAAAHAVLQTTAPERGDRLDAAPADVRLSFNEPVEAAFGAIRVFDASGKRVDAGAAFRPGGSKTAGVKLRPGLPDGGYTATFRVISADGHPVSGGFVFSVGDGAGTTQSVEELLAGTDSGPVTSTAFAAVRALQYAAIALGLGAVIFLLACWSPALRSRAGGGEDWAAASEAFAARLRTLLAGAAAAGAATAAAILVLQGATASGSTFWSALDGAVVGDVAGTRFGTAWAAGLVLWAIVLAGVLVRRPAPVLRPASVGATGLAMPGARLPWVALPLFALAFVPALAGHAGVTSPRGLLVPANVVHVAAMAAWMGGIGVLVLALRGATAALESPADRTRLLSSVVGRFSTLAGVAVAVIAATGVIQSVVHLGAFGQLLDTAFGRAIGIKSVLFVVLISLGFVNRSRLLPELKRLADSGEAPGRAGVLIRRVLRAEVVLGLAVLATTGALAQQPPSSSANAGPFSADAPLGPARIEVTVDPARVGPNEIHVYLFDRRSGAQYDAFEEVTAKAELPGKGIEPIALDPAKAGPGHLTIAGAALGVPGDWQLDITAREGEFEAHVAQIEIPVK